MPTVHSDAYCTQTRNECLDPSNFSCKELVVLGSAGKPFYIDSQKQIHEIDCIGFIL